MPTVGLSATAANSLLAKFIADGYVWVKLHVGIPGAAGTANPAAETTRKQMTWGTPASGGVDETNAVTWTAVAATEVYTHYSLWTASTAGTFGLSGVVAAGSVTVGSDWSVPIGAHDLTFPLATT